VLKCELRSCIQVAIKCVNLHRFWNNFHSSLLNIHPNNIRARSWWFKKLHSRVLSFENGKSNFYQNCHASDPQMRGRGWSLEANFGVDGKYVISIGFLTNWWNITKNTLFSYFFIGRLVCPPILGMPCCSPPSQIHMLAPGATPPTVWDTSQRVHTRWDSPKRVFRGHTKRLPTDCLMRHPARAAGRLAALEDSNSKSTFSGKTTRPTQNATRCWSTIVTQYCSPSSLGSRLDSNWNVGTLQCDL